MNTFEESIYVIVPTSKKHLIESILETLYYRLSGEDTPAPTAEYVSVCNDDTMRVIKFQYTARSTSHIDSLVERTIEVENFVYTDSVAEFLEFRARVLGQMALDHIATVSKVIADTADGQRTIGIGLKAVGAWHRDFIKVFPKLDRANLGDVD